MLGRGQAQFLLLFFIRSTRSAILLKFKAIGSGKLEIHHIMYLLFLPQTTLTMSTLSCSIPWITLCHHQNIEIIITQPLPLWPVLSGENITQLAKTKKSSPVTAAMRPSKEIWEVRMFQTAGLSLRSPCVAHQWAQRINTPPFLGSKHQPLS